MGLQSGFIVLERVRNILSPTFGDRNWNAGVQICVIADLPGFVCMLKNATSDCSYSIPQNMLFVGVNDADRLQFFATDLSTRLIRII